MLSCFVACAGWRWGCHLYHQLQRVGDRKTLDHCHIGWQPCPDFEPAFEPHSHRSAAVLEPQIFVTFELISALLPANWHVSPHIRHFVLSVKDLNCLFKCFIRLLSLFSGETHTVPGTSLSYTLAGDVALLSRNIKIIGEEYPQMLDESFGARLLVGTFSWAGIDYKGNYFKSNM